VRSRLALAACAAALLVAAAPLHAGSLAPAVEPAAKGTRCVEDPAVMRRNHMAMLKHQRDATVHAGMRGAKHGLKECVDCHASSRTGSVAAAPTDFCQGCHTYAAVSIDCFECHSSKPQRVGSAKP
jgi:hypothetical protein